MKDTERKASLAMRPGLHGEDGHSRELLLRLDVAYRSGHITASELKQELAEIRRVERDSGRTSEVAE